MFKSALHLKQFEFHVQNTNVKTLYLIKHLYLYSIFLYTFDLKLYKNISIGVCKDIKTMMKISSSKDN